MHCEGMRETRLRLIKNGASGISRLSNSQCALGGAQNTSTLTRTATAFSLGSDAFSFSS
jgi:hypothetical protein